MSTDLSPAALRALADVVRHHIAVCDSIGTRIRKDILENLECVLRALADRASAMAGEGRERIARLLWETAGDDSAFRDELTSDWQSFWDNSSIARSTLCSVTDRIIADRGAAISRAREEMRERCAQAAFKWWDGEPEDGHELREHLRTLPLSPSQPSSTKGEIEPTPTRDQIAAVMLQHGTPDQQREALAYAGIATPPADVDAAVAAEPDWNVGPECPKATRLGSRDTSPEALRESCQQLRDLINGRPWECAGVNLREQPDHWLVVLARAAGRLEALGPPTPVPTLPDRRALEGSDHG